MYWVSNCFMIDHSESFEPKLRTYAPFYRLQWYAMQINHYTAAQVIQVETPFQPSAFWWLAKLHAADNKERSAAVADAKINTSRQEQGSNLRGRTHWMTWFSEEIQVQRLNHSAILTS